MPGCGLILRRMQTALRLAALGVVLVTVVVWLFGGPNLGWTKTSVPTERIEEVTGNKYTVWEKRFLPGVDFVAVGLAAGTVLLGVSFLFHRKTPALPAQPG